LRECRQLGLSRLVTVIGPLELVRGNVPERLEQAVPVVPRDPVQGGELDLLDAFPRPAPVDQVGLVEPDDRFGQARCRTGCCSVGCRKLNRGISELGHLQHLVRPSLSHRLRELGMSESLRDPYTGTG
jgi:hypothetical protein